MSDATRWTILHGGALGDLCLTLRLAVRLPGAGRDAALHVVSRVDPGGLSDCRPAVCRTAADNLPLHWLFGDADDPPPDRLRDLLAGRAVLSALGGPGDRVHRNLLRVSGHVYSFDPRPRPGDARHINEQWAAQLAAQGLQLAEPLDPPIEPSQRLRHEGCRRLEAQNLRPGVVLIHPGSGGRAKCWPLEAFELVARRLRDLGREVTFVTGPVEDELWPRQVLEALVRRWPTCRCEATSELAALLGAAGVLVGNDAGPGHLAALLGTPTVTLFGPTAAGIWRPLGPRAVAIQSDPALGAEWGIDPVQVAQAALQACPP